MILKVVIEKMKIATAPVTAVLHKNESSRVVVLGLKEGVKLKEHKTDIPAKITVLFGKVDFTLPEGNHLLQQYDTLEIPLNIMHSVIAHEDSLCIITKG